MADDHLPELGHQAWDLDDHQCDCPSAPQQFLIPPPPPPPSLRVCGGDHLYCHLEPMGAEFTQSTFPSLPIIAVCSSVVLVAVLVASFLIWRHKTKVQNLLPCKHDQQGHCDLATANGVTYEDVLINHHPTRLPPNHITGSQTLMPIELLDVKLGDIGPPQVPPIHHGAYFQCHERSQMLSGKHFKPVYEEVSPGKMDMRAYDSDLEESAKGGRSLSSEDDFAEDELSAPEYPSGEGSRHCSATSSVQGSTGGDLCRDPVSSDEGAGDDCVFGGDNLPGMLTDNNILYPGSNLDPQCSDELIMGCISNDLPPDQAEFIYNDVGDSEETIQHHPLQVPNLSSYPQPNKLPHSSVSKDKGHSLSPSSKVLPCSTFMAPISKKDFSNVPSRQGQASFPKVSQWRANAMPLNDMVSCLGPSPVENIYSTIDEQDISDSDLCLTTTSRTHQPQLSGSPLKQNSVVPNKAAALEDKRKTSSQLSQRSTEDENGSYGDIMPAIDNSSFT